jgi:hypothetical protein
MLERIGRFHVLDMGWTFLIPIDNRGKVVKDPLDGSDAFLLVYLVDLKYSHLHVDILKEFDMLRLQKCSKIIDRVTPNACIYVIVLLKFFFKLHLRGHLRVVKAAIDHNADLIAASPLHASLEERANKSYRLLSLHVAVVVKLEEVGAGFN